jgi:mRNA interferase RelE/StbE
MKILIDRSFERDAKRLPIDIQQRVKKLIEQLQISETTSDLKAEKLAGAQNAYKIRMGDYRIGFYKEGDNLILSRILNRKEIYRYFPKK